MLSVLPFVTTFNSVLTEVINRLGWYRAMQNILVPFESRLVIVIVRALGVNAFMANAGDGASFFLLKDKIYTPIDLQWNCLGWQSMLLLGLSFLFGYEGKFKKLTIIQSILIGILGTFLINLFRMAFIVWGLYYINSIFALLLHDYFAALTTIAWLLVFWWFSYKYVLE